MEVPVGITTSMYMCWMVDVWEYVQVWVVVAVDEMKPQLDPALTPGVVPTVQESVDEFTAVQPLADGVEPSSKPPAPVGEIST